MQETLKQKQALIKVLNWVIVFLIILAIFFVPFNKHLVKRFIYLGLFFLLILKLIEFFSGKSPLFKKTYINKPLLLFLAVMLFTTLLSKDFYEAQKIFVERILFYAGIFLLVKETIDTRIKIYLILATFIFGGFIVGLDGLWQYFKGYDFFFGYPKMDPGVGKVIAISGPFGRYNLFSGYLEIVLPLLAILSLIRKKIYTKIFILLTLILLIFCWINIFERGTWLSVILSIFLILFFMKRKYLYYYLIILIFIALLIPPYGYERIHKTFQPGGDTGRFGFWKQAIDIFLKHPLIGTGLGGYSRYSESIGSIHIHAHNTYLELLADTGIVGLLSFLFLLGVFLKNSFFYIPKIENENKKIIFLGLLASSLSSFIIGLLSTNMLVGITFATPFWIIFTLAVILKDIEF